jgi:hypothetical protein
MRFSVLILAMFLVIPATAIAAKPGKAKKTADVKDTTQKEAIKEIVKETLQEVATSKKNEDEIKINAVLEAGIDINNRVDEDRTEYNKIGYGKIEISARPVRKVRAEFGFEYNKRNDRFILDKLYAQYGIGEFGTVRAGYMKKAFGLEEKAGVEERYFHKRSEINDNLEKFEILGHDLTLQYRHKLNDSWRLIGGFSWIDTTHYLQNYSVEYETEKTNLVLSTIVSHYTKVDNRNDPPKKDITTFASSLAYKRIAKFFVNEAELSLGLNRLIKEKDEDAFYLGLRLQEYFPINTGLKTLRQVIPIAEAAYYADDMRESNWNSNFDAQFRAGVTLGFAKNSAFQWRNTYGQVLRIRDEDLKTHRRRFDSEVVVIF